MATVVRAEAKITAQNALRPGINSAINDLKRFKQASDQMTRMQAAQAQLTNFGRMAATAAGGFVAYRAVDMARQSVKEYSKLERSMTRVAITGNASREEQEAALKSIRQLALESATTTENIVKGLDAFVARGRNVKEGMQFLPAIVRTAQAANAEVEDMAKTAVSIQDNMKIGAESMAAAFDAVVAGGNMGSFEAKNMARYLPGLLPLASQLGFRGQDGLNEMIAQLQTIAAGTGSIEQANSAMENILSKFESDKTIKGLADMLAPLGMDAKKVEKQFMDTRKSGGNLVKTLLDLIKTATKGDFSLIGKIIDDQQFKTGVIALLTMEDKLNDFRRQMKNTAGVVDQQFNRVLGDTQATLDRLSESTNRLQTAVGQSFSQTFGPVSDAWAKDFNSLAEGLERANKAAQDAKSGGVFSGIFNEVAKGWGAHLKEQEANNQRIRDERTLARMGSRGITDNPEARGLQNTIGMLENLPSRSAAQEAALKRHKARLAQLSGPVTPNAGELGALSREIGRSITEGVEAFNKDPKNKGGLLFGMSPEHRATFDMIREAAQHRANRAPLFGGPPGNAAPGLPVPPVRQNTPPRFDAMPVNALDDAVAKTEEVKTNFQQAEAAAKGPGAAFAASVKTGVDQAIADLERFNAAARSVAIPGIGRGFPTGRSMSEVE
ncbi:MAG: phage tail tape measure protein [Methylobacterium sp.]|nr:phage tail tape measure protein [Methylobacterium sp.]MCA3653593.1 phage tail tape measure protein [Methylobacterium sp.]